MLWWLKQTNITHQIFGKYRNVEWIKSYIIPSPSKTHKRMTFLAQSGKQGALTTLLPLAKVFMAVAFRKLGRISHLKSLFQPKLDGFWPFLFVLGFFFFFFFFVFSGGAPSAYGGSQFRGLIGAVAASLHQSHSNTGSLTH